MRCTTLTRMELSNNPLGEVAVRAMLRAVAKRGIVGDFDATADPAEITAQTVSPITLGLSDCKMSVRRVLVSTASC